MTLMDKVTVRVNSGDINALNDLTTLPGDWAVPGLLIFFKQNYNAPEKTRETIAIYTKAAQLVATVPGGENYMVKLLKNAHEEESNGIYFQEVSAINAMLLVNNKMSVRVLCSGLADTEMGGRAAEALTSMLLPGAPYFSRNASATSKAKGLAEWKKWWEDNKANYTEKAAASQTPAVRGLD